MSRYRVTFFKNLLSSDGHPFKCIQLSVFSGRSIFATRGMLKEGVVRPTGTLKGRGLPCDVGRRGLVAHLLLAPLTGECLGRRPTRDGLSRCRRDQAFVP
jgi:hypothetical protein